MPEGQKAWSQCDRLDFGDLVAKRTAKRTYVAEGLKILYSKNQI